MSLASVFDNETVTEIRDRWDSSGIDQYRHLPCLFSQLSASNGTDGTDSCVLVPMRERKVARPAVLLPAHRSLGLKCEPSATSVPAPTSSKHGGGPHA